LQLIGIVAAIGIVKRQAVDKGAAEYARQGSNITGRVITDPALDVDPSRRDAGKQPVERIVLVNKVAVGGSCVALPALNSDIAVILRGGCAFTRSCKKLALAAAG